MADIDTRSGRPRSAPGPDDNIDPRTIAGFGREWTAFSQSKLGGKEYEDLFRAYFGTFPFDELPPNAEGFDLGCGSGRWAVGVAARVGKLHCIDPASGALHVARARLSEFDNVEFHLASASNIPLADGSQDFGYSLGVLHHIPDTGRALADAVRKLKPGAPFLVYIYYNLENRPKWYRALWRCTDQVRRVISRLHFPISFGVTNIIAAGVYWPLARFAKLLSSFGIDASNVPLSGYRDLSFYMMRTDALDRFGTVLEKRFTRPEIESMMRAAGLEHIQFAESEPYWVACGRAGQNSRDDRQAENILAPEAKRRRILHVISGLGPGGAETVLFRLATTSTHFDHQVVSLGRRDWYSSRLEERGVVVRHIRSDTLASAIPGIVKLYRVMSSDAPDLIQGWMYRGNVMAGVCARMAGLPVLWNIRCSTLAPLRLGSRMLARVGGALAGWIPEYVINCSVQSAHLHAALGYDRADGGVIANGYDPEVFRPDEKSRTAFRSSLGIGADGFLLGSIGRWHPQKGLPELLKSLRLLIDRDVPARLVLVGRGLSSSNAHLARLVKQSRTEAFVTLLGERADIPEIARLPDLHVLASIGTEGFPNVVAETMLSGTPNVATNVGDAALIVGETGWIVEPGDPGELADAIAKAYHEWQASPDRWDQRRVDSRERIADKFGLERMVGHYEEVWRKVAETRARQPANRE